MSADLFIGDPGIARPVLIDGVELSVMPSEFDMLPEPVSDYLDMFDGGAREFQRRPYFDGVNNYSDRVTFSFPIDQIRGENMRKMQLILARGGTHRITVWRMSPVVFSCVSGVQRYYLPRFRKVAGHLYAGLTLSGGGVGDTIVTTDAFPLIATLNDADLAVTYAEGPTLVAPGAGGIVIARQPDTSGAATDYVAVRMGDSPDTGDELILWSCWTHETSLRDPRISVRGPQESHSYTFVEL